MGLLYTTLEVATSRVRQSSSPTIPPWVILRQVVDELAGWRISSPHSSTVAGIREWANRATGTLYGRARNKYLVKNNFFNFFLEQNQTTPPVVSLHMASDFSTACDGFDEFPIFNQAMRAAPASRSASGNDDDQ